MLEVRWTELADGEADVFWQTAWIGSKRTALFLVGDGAVVLSWR